MADLFLWKAGGGAVFFAVSMIFGMLPLSIRSTAWLSLATVFGGGVFIGAAFLHLLAEAAETMAKASSFPWAFMLCITGYMMMIAVEWIAEHVCLQQGQLSYSLLQHAHTHEHGGGVADEELAGSTEMARSPRRRSRERENQQGEQVRPLLSASIQIKEL